MHTLRSIINEINQIDSKTHTGRIHSIKGSLLEVSGLRGFISVGAVCAVQSHGGEILAEVAGFSKDHALLLPFGTTNGLVCGAAVRLVSEQSLVYPSAGWIGRVINAHAQPIDDKGAILQGHTAYNLHNEPISAHQRKRIGAKIKLGVKAIDAFLSCCVGQRLGVFAGSGVGKSTLVSMCTKFSDPEIIRVIGLIGERGREVQEFLEDYLGPKGLERAVVIVSTSDEPALMRRRAAYLTMTVCEYYRDQGYHVLCMLDNVTRFAMAQREISLTLGEVPASRGYTPSVFAELPRLLERAGPGKNGSGDITALFSTLVEGGDIDEPITDAVRGILDGHIMLSRKIAERRYPAIDVLGSISRSMPMCNTADEQKVIQEARKLLADYEEMRDMIRLGIYKPGTNPKVDKAITCYERLEDFLQQGIDEEYQGDLYQKLQDIIS